MRTSGLQVALRLHVAAHHAEAHLRLAVAGQEAGDDGVERPLAARHHVGVAAEREAMAAVLQADAGARHHDAAAEAHVVALDQADHHAAFVGRGQVDRAAARGRAVLRRSCARLGVDQLRAARPGRCRTAGLAGVTSVMAGVGHPAVGVGEGQLHRLDLQVLRRQAVDRVAAEVQLVEHAQRHQRGDALAVGRDLVHRVAGKVLLDRA
jgi:hypothetical protein